MRSLLRWDATKAGHALSMLCVTAALIGGSAGARKADGNAVLRTYAVVFQVRGSVSGNIRGSNGLFVRSDDGWRRITMSNVFAFGLGYYDQGDRRSYYLAAGNGLHRSTDGGAHWRVLTSWTTEEILGVAPDPRDASILYVATPEGVFKTVDGGATWAKKMTGFQRRFVGRIIIDPRDRQTLYAAAEDDLYKTTDAGDSWTGMGTGVRTQVLAVCQCADAPDDFVVASEDHGILYSSDDGRSWHGSDDLSSSTVYAFGESASGGVLYAGGWKTGLWRSTDRGKSWTQARSDPSVEAVYSVASDPQRPDHLLIGTAGNGVYESTDSGSTWVRCGLEGAEVTDIRYYP